MSSANAHKHACFPMESQHSMIAFHPRHGITSQDSVALGPIAVQEHANKDRGMISGSMRDIYSWPKCHTA